MTDLAWMKVYIGDEAALTGHLTAEEFGAYERLRRHYWQHRHLPDDDARLMRITCVEPERWSAIAPAIVPLLAAALPKLDQARTDAADKREKKVAAGRKGAVARWADGKTIANANGKGMANAMAKPSVSHKPPAPAPASDEVRYEEGSVPTRTPAHEEPIPTVGSLAQARAWLIDQGVFPGDVDWLARKMVDFSLDWEDVRRSAA